MGDLWLVRHGETEWSRTRRHTGRTDVPLTEHGETQARALAPRLDRPWAAILASPLQRAWRTAELAGLDPRAEPDLVEWDYGPAEGLTTDELSAEKPWRVWDGVPLGETLEDVADRVRRVLAALPDDGDVCLVAHGHLLRVVAAVRLGWEPRTARQLVLDAGRIGIIGREHEWPAVKGWNL